MKKMTLAAVLISLSFATGFTCSKNSPPAEVQTTAPAETANAADPAAAQAQMATAPEGTQSAEAAKPAQANTNSAATPAETKPAAPVPVTK